MTTRIKIPWHAFSVRCFVVRVGREGAKEQQDIILYGTYIKEEHCLFENEDGKDCLLINISSDRLKWRPMPDINVGIYVMP